MRAARLYYGFDIIFFVFIGIVLFTQPNNRGKPFLSDCGGYHVWVHQLLIGPIDSCEWKQMGLIETPNGNCVNKYPAGTALPTLPVFYFLRSKLEKGKYLPFEYQVVAATAAVALLLIYLLLVHCAVLSGLSPLLARITTLCFVFGSGIFHYGTYDAGFSHIYSCLGISLLLNRILAIDTSEGIAHPWKSRFNNLLIFFDCFWLLAIRSTNIFLIFAIAAVVLWDMRRKYQLRPLVVAMGLGTILGISVQVAYVRYVLGYWGYSAYLGEGFNWNHPMFLEVLASYERGILNYYPILILCTTIAILTKWRNTWNIVALLTVLFYAALYGFWHSWHLGGGFGHRGFVEVSPFIAVATFKALKRLPESKRLGFALACVVAALLSTVLMINYWSGSLNYAGTDAATYWLQFSSKTIIDSVSYLLTRASISRF